MIAQTWLVLWTNAGELFLAATELERVEAYAAQFRDDEIRDQFIEVQHRSGAVVFVLVSSIEVWYLSTPEFRAAEREYEQTEFGEAVDDDDDPPPSWR